MILNLFYSYIVLLLYSMAVKWSNAENPYFLLNLKLPDIKKDVQHKIDKEQTPKKYNYLIMLENLFERDLKTGNPWFGWLPHKTWKMRYLPNVRFSLTEIEPAGLPHCRHRGLGRVGHLHTSKCANSVHETVHVMRDTDWLNQLTLDTN
jgi:hypothetical protein